MSPGADIDFEGGSFAHARCSRPIRRNLRSDPEGVSMAIEASVTATTRRSPISSAAPVRLDLAPERRHAVKLVVCPA